ncbi:MAG: antibiotic biosynthesis monooxygenase [Bacteroidota bacterium]
MKPQPPYYAVIFTNRQTQQTEGYSQMADRMEALAREQPGFLGFEHARDQLGISISYWRSLDDIATWKGHMEHLKAQHLGQEQWYQWYRVRICLVERDYEFGSPE